MTNQLSSGAMFDAVSTSAFIKRFQPVDSVSTYYQAEVLRLIERTPYFAKRYFYEPGHLTAQAIVYKPATNAVAMMRHKKLGMDLFFGGHCEPEDHSLLDTARREAREEGGISDLTLVNNAPFDIDIHGFPARGDQPDHLHFDIRFLFTCNAEAQLLQNDESDGVFWVPVPELRTRLPLWLSNSRLVHGLERLYG